MSASSDWQRTARLALLAFVLGLGGVALGGSNVWFLWTAFKHGGL